MSYGEVRPTGCWESYSIGRGLSGYQRIPCY